MLLLHASNNYGVYKLQHEKRINGKRGCVTCQFFTKSRNAHPVLPTYSTKIYDTRQSVEITTRFTRQIFQITNQIKEDIISRSSKRRIVELEPVIGIKKGRVDDKCESDDE